MARNPANLYASNNIPVAKTIVVAADTTKQRIIRKATFCNDTGGPVIVSLYVDATGSAEIPILDTKTINDAETYSVADIEGHMLEKGGTISVISDTANVNLLITGMDVT